MCLSVCIVHVSIMVMLLLSSKNQGNLNSLNFDILSYIKTQLFEILTSFYDLSR